ncbi:hypothetical protein RP20_CCG000545 [Aedes albopictus]|nr:hypothetical protein RP20_CCG000545 [Aedes albopictus]
MNPTKYNPVTLASNSSNDTIEITYRPLCTASNQTQANAMVSGVGANEDQLNSRKYGEQLPGLIRTHTTGIIVVMVIITPSLKAPI